MYRKNNNCELCNGNILNPCFLCSEMEIQKCLYCSKKVNKPQKCCEECKFETTLQVGKYKGQTYEYILDTDKSYCKWVLRLKEPSYGLLHFYEWLKDKVETPTNR